MKFGHIFAFIFSLGIAPALGSPGKLPFGKKPSTTYPSKEERVWCKIWQKWPNSPLRDAVSVVEAWKHATVRIEGRDYTFKVHGRCESLEVIDSPWPTEGCDIFVEFYHVEPKTWAIK